MSGKVVDTDRQAAIDAMCMAADAAFREVSAKLTLPGREG